MSDLYLDCDKMIQELHDKTGVDIDLITIVIDAETDYLIKVGIACEVK